MVVFTLPPVDFFQAAFYMFQIVLQQFFFLILDLLPLVQEELMLHDIHSIREILLPVAIRLRKGLGDKLPDSQIELRSCFY